MELKTYNINKKLENIKISNISLSNFNSVKEINTAEISNLAAIIRKNGILSPLLIRRDIKNYKKFILVSNINKFLALKFLNIQKAPAIILSLTDIEAEILSFLENEYISKQNVFEQAETLNHLLKEGKFSPAELADQIGISVNNLKKKLSVLLLNKKERDFIINHNFSFDFTLLFLSLEQEEKDKILNHIILNKLDNNSSVEYIKEYKNPPKKTVKAAPLSDDIIIKNSIERIADSLRSVGITASFEKTFSDGKTEYKLIVENKPKQMNFNI